MPDKEWNKTNDPNKNTQDLDKNIINNNTDSGICTKSEIFTKLQTIVQNLFPNIDQSKVTLQSKIFEDFGTDSLDKIEIILKIEENFNIEINDNDAEKIKTVNELVNYIHISIDKK